MTETSSLKIIIFDLFGVMIRFDNDIVYRRLAEHCTDPQFAVKALDGLMSGLNVITGRQSLSQTYSVLQATLGLMLNFHDFVKAWNEPYSDSMPGMPQLLEALRPNYTLILLTNVDTDYWQSIQPMHSEFALFHHLVISGEVGLAKPDPAIYRHGVSLAGAKPEACLFIDDTLRNVDAAAPPAFKATGSVE